MIGDDPFLFLIKGRISMRDNFNTVFIIIITLVLITFTGCAISGDTARVTIDTGLSNQQAAKVSLFDRFLALVSFSTPAVADPPNGQLGVYSISLSVQGPGMDAMNGIQIPLDTGKITLEVPAGEERKFMVVGWNESSEREYGGIKTIDLKGGTSVNIVIQMGLLPDPPDNLGSSGNYPDPIVFTWDYTTPPSNLAGFVVYRATASDGPYIPLIAGRKEEFDTGSNYQYTDSVEGFSQNDYIYSVIIPKQGKGNKK